MWAQLGLPSRPTLARLTSVVALGAALLLMVPARGTPPAPAPDPAPAPARELMVDTAQSQVHFDIGVLVVMRRSGTFSELEGSVAVDADAKVARILIRIPSASARMRDPEQTELLLSPDFFDARAHPWIEFRSDSMPLESSQASEVHGSLRIRGIERPVVFALQADACLANPGLTRCQVRVEGSIKRSTFGMVGFKRTLADTVHLRINLVLRRSPKSKHLASAQRASTKTKAGRVRKSSS